MQTQPELSTWDFTPVINLLHTLSPREANTPSPLPLSPPAATGAAIARLATVLVEDGDAPQLGDFRKVFEFLGQAEQISETPAIPSSGESGKENYELTVGDALLGKGVRWRDEVDGADLEDNAEPDLTVSAASLRTQKRAARRARAKQKQELSQRQAEEPAQKVDSATEGESEAEVHSVRHSADRRAIIQQILHGSMQPDYSTPTTSSPPKQSNLTPKKLWPISQPHLWNESSGFSFSSRPQVQPLLQLTPAERKAKLILMLIERHPEESKYLINPVLQDPSFCAGNVLDIGIHVFVDISNVSFSP